MTSDRFSQHEIAARLEQLAIPENVVLQREHRTTLAMNGIKSYILRENLGPGAPLPTEAALGSSLGVSRSSIREAMQKLQALDIVEVRHGSGSFVGRMTLDPMVETLALRAHLSAEGNLEFIKEVAYARKILDLGMAEDIVRAHSGKRNPVLEQLTDGMLENAHLGKTFVSEDAQFHNQLISILGNKLLQQTYSAFWMVHSTILPNLLPEDNTGQVDTAIAHRAMLEAAYAGDLEAYNQAVLDHYRPLESALERLN